MTVWDLIDCGDDLDLIEVIIRSESCEGRPGCGKWLQGYRIGKKVELFPGDLTAEIIEKKKIKNRFQVTPLKEGEVIDTEYLSSLPMRIICKDVSKTPDAVKALRVAHYLPRHIPRIHGDALTHNEFSLEIWAIPPEVAVRMDEEKERPTRNDNQLRLCLEG